MAHKKISKQCSLGTQHISNIKLFSVLMRCLPAALGTQLHCANSLEIVRLSWDSSLGQLKASSTVRILEKGRIMSFESLPSAAMFQVH